MLKAKHKCINLNKCRKNMGKIRRVGKYKKRKTMILKWAVLELIILQIKWWGFQIVNKI
jgi:hypothetical protein